MRTYIYVDGFNLYNSGLKQDRSIRWLDIRAMCMAVLRPENHIVGLRYFTARISEDAAHPGGPVRQDAYIRALMAHTPNFTVHYGQFRSSTRRRPLSNPPSGGPRTVEVIERCEKGSDVNLAVRMLDDAWRDQYDCAVVVSNDSDLAESLALVRELNKKVGVVTTSGRPTAELNKNCDFFKRVRNSHFVNSQLPPIVVDGNGREIHRPDRWA